MKDPRKARPAAVDIRRAVYAMATTDGQSAEITMYGDIYEQHPTDWFGDPVEGQFITLTEFLEDLGQIAACKDITIRMNSYGGDAGVSNTIHNRLRELARGGAKLTCVVDGVAMSGGSLIMCACDTVKVNPSSLIMIHKCWGFFWGGYNADELREAAGQYDAWDKAQIAIYKRKTGLTETVLSHMMSDTTYMTGREAVEKGFADELIEDAEPLDVAASADGRRLFVRGRTIHLTPGMFAPDNIPTANPETKLTTAAMGWVYPAAIPAKTRPEAAQIAEDDAVQTERTRLQDIDALASQFDGETIQAAKYGPDACTAQEMAYRAAQKAAKAGKSYLASMMSDTEDSGANGVGAASASSEPTGGELTPEQRMTKGRADARALSERKEKR